MRRESLRKALRLEVARRAHPAIDQGPQEEGRTGGDLVGVNNQISQTRHRPDLDRELRAKDGPQRSFTRTLTRVHSTVKGLSWLAEPCHIVSRQARLTCLSEKRRREIAARLVAASTLTVRRWWRRYQQHGHAGPQQHSRSPRRHPLKASPERVLALHQQLRMFGAAQRAVVLGFRRKRSTADSAVFAARIQQLLDRCGITLRDLVW